MPLYDKPVRVILKDMIGEFKTSGRTKFDTSDAIDWFAQRYPLVKEGTIRAHLRRFSANDPNRIHYSLRPGEGLLFKLGPSSYRMYDPDNDPPEIVSKTKDTEPSDDEDGPVSPASQGGVTGDSQFAYERDLQNFLAKNLNLLEEGLKLYEDDEGGINGIEFDVGGRRIDILATDANNDLVVIELKVSRGYDKVVGQILRYMSWIKKNQAESTQNVRGIIVAREISEDLRLATSLVPGVLLYEYELAINLTKCDAEPVGA